MSLERKVMEEKEKKVELKPLYSLAPEVNPDAFNNIVIDEKSMRLWSLGSTRQRYAVVGWIIKDKIHLRLRPGFLASSTPEELKAAQEEFGDNIVVSQKDRVGIVHEELVRQVLKDEPQLIIDSIKISERKTSSLESKIRRSFMIGASVVKDLNQCIWVNRSSQNMPTFIRDSLALSCHIFFKDGIHHPYTLEHGINRSIPEEYFFLVMKNATAQLLTKGFESNYRIEDENYFFVEKEWKNIITMENKTERDELIKSKLQRTIDIAFNGDLSRVKLVNPKDILNRAFQVAKMYRIKFDNPSWLVVLQKWMDNGQLRKWVEGPIRLHEVAIEVIRETKRDFDALKVLAKKFVGEEWNKKYEEGLLSRISGREESARAIYFLILAKKIDINAVSDSGFTPLDIAINSEDFDVVEALISEGAHITLSSITLALNKNNSAILVSLYSQLKEQHPFIKRADDSERFDLYAVSMLAAKSGHIEKLKSLEKEGVVFDKEKMLRIASPDTLEVVTQFFEAITKRKEMGKILNRLPEFKGKSAVIENMTSKMNDLFKYSVPLAFLNFPDEKSEQKSIMTVAHIAAQEGHIEVLKHLEEVGEYFDEKMISLIPSGKLDEANVFFKAVSIRKSLVSEINELKEYDSEVTEGLKDLVLTAYHEGTPSQFLEYKFSDILKSSLPFLLQMLKDIEQLTEYKKEGLSTEEKTGVENLKRTADDIKGLLRESKGRNINDKIDPVLAILQAELSSLDGVFSKKQKRGAGLFSGSSVPVNPFTMKIKNILSCFAKKKATEEKKITGAGGPSHSGMGF